MVYHVIGLMSGSSLDGLDIVFVEFHENGGKWSFEIKHGDCYAYSQEWIDRLKGAISLPALEYQLLHSEYGHYLGKQVNHFIATHHLNYQVSLVASHGHTSFHLPGRSMTAQLGDGAAIAAETQLPVVTDLRALDVALGGQGAPIVPIGEKLLLNEFDYFLNLGGIANITFSEGGRYVAFDVCPANRILNMLTNEKGKEYDEGGRMAATGEISTRLINELNSLDYYKQAYPKSLSNDFGTDTVYPIIKKTGLHTQDALRTYSEHIVIQIKNVIEKAGPRSRESTNIQNPRLLVTGGGAFNEFLVTRLKHELQSLNVDVVVPEAKLINYKEALIMALIGVLRWRQEYNVMASVTGASRDSIGGALWIGD